MQNRLNSGRRLLRWLAPAAPLRGLSRTGFVSRRMDRAASRLDWRAVAIVAIKAVHSGIFLLNATSVLYIFWVGVFNRRSR
jgi:hypothetical protein